MTDEQNDANKLDALQPAEVGKLDEHCACEMHGFNQFEVDVHMIRHQAPPLLLFLFHISIAEARGRNSLRQELFETRACQTANELSSNQHCALHEVVGFVARTRSKLHECGVGLRQQASLEGAYPATNERAIVQDLR